MFELLKIRTVNICMDIYSDLGKLLKHILDEEERIFKHVAGIWFDMIEMTLSLARMELDQKEKNEEERYHN